MPTDRLAKSSKTQLAIFALAFRPLFLFASLFAVLAIAWWSYYWFFPFPWSPYGGATWWHAHEMLFGFAIAVVTGFLLTAVKNWTGVPGISGRGLAGLVSVWILARLLMAFSNGVASSFVMSVDVSYLLLCAVAMAIPIIKVKQWRNIMFVPILLILAGLNATTHWAKTHGQSLLAIHTLHATVMMFILIITIIGGRVIPMFTANGTGKPRKPALSWVEILAILSTASLVVIALIGIDQVNARLAASVSLIAAIAHFIRLSRWGGQHTRSIPLLWSLHLSYLSIPIGLLLLTLHSLGLLDNLGAVLHCFTVGAIGGMILSMISRVALGHTGRPLKTSKMMSTAFGLILISALIRVILPAWFPQWYQWGIGLAGIFWVAAFTIHLLVYTPILARARIDGRPG